MSEQILEMTAYCGLVCSDCLRYRSEITETAGSLLAALEKGQFHRYAEVKMKFDTAFGNYPVFIDMLKKIVGLECRQSCRIGGGCAAIDCTIYKCCVEHQYEGCWECGDLSDCNEFDFLKPFHGETPRNNCIDLRNNGFDGFASRKQAFYIW
jgi:hypothetical protein